MKYLELLGRILFSIIFLKTIQGHFTSGYVGYAASTGVPLASVMVPLSGVIAILGALSIILGYKGKLGAWLIVIFLIPVTFFMHNFWTVSDPMAAMSQAVSFWKNLSMLGGALIITYFGSGPVSIDSWMKSRKKPS
ncbi:MAG: DoxX family protein [Ignavibacteria bacterium]|jgi:putative oxidoreductase